MSCLLVLVLAALPISAGDEGRPVKGVGGPAQGVIPSLAKPTPASARALATEEENERAEANVPPPSSEHTKTETQRRKSLGQQPNLRTGGKEIHLDSTPTPLAPNVGTNFGGLGQNGWIPYDAAIAVGPNHVVAMTNSQWIVYDRAGATMRAVTGFGTWWGTAAGTPFDPKCFYDPVGGRFVMMAVSQTTTGGNKAFYHLSISQTGDPTGSWYNYQFDATKDGTTSTSNWADFPGLGYDDSAIYITSNQFTFSSGGIFQYAKIRVLSKTQLYGGSAATFTDFVGATLSNGDNSQAFTVQPARTLSSTASEYFLNTNSNSSNTVTLWRVDGAPASPSLVRQATYSIGAFAFPPDAPQPGTTTKVSTNDDRMYDFVWRNGIIHAAFGEAFSGLAAARYLRLDTTNNTVLKDVTYTQPTVHYFFPAVTDDAAGNLYMIFSRSSSSEYPSVYQTGMTPADSAIEPSALVKAGVAPNTSGRWGDYSAIVNDPADNLAVVSYAGWGNTSNRWATWITGTTFAGGTSTPTLLSVTPSSGMQGANINVTLTGQNTNWVQGTSVIGISGSGVSASSVNVTAANTMTATFNITASAATGTRNVSVTTGAEVTTSAPFTVNAAGSPPTLNPLSPNKGQQSLNVPVTLSGTNFVPGNTTLNINTSGVTITNVNFTSSTAGTATFNIAASATVGDWLVSVTTPGGTSNTRFFTVFGIPRIDMLTPANTPAGTSVAVTITGAQFAYGTFVFSGSGITMTNRVNNASYTQIKCTFTVAGGTAAGPQTLRLTNAAGTSNGVSFNVGSTPALPTLASVNPNNGNPGQMVNATLTGANFLPATTVNVSGTGVTPSNVVIVNTTTIRADLVIAGGATPGARNASVTTSGGTSGTQPFTVNSTGPSITTTSLPNGTVAVAYNQSVAATGGTQPYTWSIILGALPTNLSLDPNTGAIKGTPNGQNTFNFTVQVTDANLQTASKPLGITIDPNTPTVQTTLLPNGTVGVAYNSGVTATGGTPPYTWSVVAGSLPAGLNLDLNTGAVTGTPGVAAVGTTNFAVQVTDSLAQTGQKALSITIAANPPSVTTASLPGGTVGTAYNQSLAASGGVTPHTWAILVGALPNGLGLDPSTGAITGTPSLAGTFYFTAQVTDAFAQTATKALSIVVSNPPAPTLNPLSPNKGQQGTAVTVTFSGTNFVPGSTSVNINTPGVTITNVNFTSGTAGTATFTVGASTAVADNLVSVTTPGGTSNTRFFSVYGVPSITNINPTSGNRSTSLTVTFNGSNFLMAQPLFSCAGITTSNRVNTIPFTQFTITFNIASAATVGTCSVRLSNLAGTSNAVAFTVN